MLCVDDPAGLHGHERTGRNIIERAPALDCVGLPPINRDQAVEVAITLDQYTSRSEHLRPATAGLPVQRGEDPKADSRIDLDVP